MSAELGVLTAPQAAALERAVVEHIVTGLRSRQTERIVAAQLLLVELERLGLPVGEAVDRQLATIPTTSWRES